MSEGTRGALSHRRGRRDELNALRLRGGEVRTISARNSRVRAQFSHRHPSRTSQTKEKVAIIGSGELGLGDREEIIGRNLLMKEGFDPEVRMWVFEEEVEVGGEARKLTS